MENILFQTAEHLCVAFSGEDSQPPRRRILIRHGDASAVIDPSGQLAFGPLAMAVSRHVGLDCIDFVFCAHEDAEAVPRLERWLHGTTTRIVASRDWIRLSGDPREDIRRKGRFHLLGQRGGQLALGRSELRVLPALPAHSECQPAIFDPVSRILFSGEIGATDLEQASPCDDFEALLPGLNERRPGYLKDVPGCREWALIVRDLRPHMIVPQRGTAIVGRQAVGRFLDWIETAGARMGLAA